MLPVMLSCLGWMSCAPALLHTVSPEPHTLTHSPPPSGKPFDPTILLSRSVSNIICSVLFGSRFDYEDERLLNIVQLINDNFQIMSSFWGEVRRPSSTAARVGGPGI